MSSEIIKNAAQYFNDKVTLYGSSPMGVDWNSTHAQEIRLHQMMKVIPDAVTNSFSINDVGCGYGHFYRMLNEKYSTGRFSYTGYDISLSMITEAKKLYSNTNAGFLYIASMDSIAQADYSVASGIFNMKMNTSTTEWENYILESISKINSSSKKGFAFNMLTDYSDTEKKRNDLYYGDSRFFFDFCKRNFSRNVALLHDYDIYDFTIIIRK